VDRFEGTARVAALSYWEIAAKEIHALRRSAVGGMGHACEFETAIQLHLRPGLVRMARLRGLPVYPVQWDLVADPPPVKVYSDWPDPRTNPGFFGDPHKARPEQGARFLDVVVDRVADYLEAFQAGRGGGSYERRPGRRPKTRGIRR
jgi:creatinine amidohydrolase